MPTSLAPTDLAAALLAHRRAFRAFLVSRVGHEADADDLLQHGLLKALQRADELRDTTKLTAWFYQILRNVIVDQARSRGAARHRDDAWAADTTALATTDREAHRQLCTCFESLIPGLKPNHAALLRLVELEDQSVSAAALTLGLSANHAALLRLVELEDQSVSAAALTLGLSANHASVTLHRARAELRAKLIDFCGSCASGACLDCDCDRPV